MNIIVKIVRIKQKMNPIILEDYSEKSMVLKGDTRQYKEDIKKLGGKWNSNLTDKKSGDKIWWMDF